MNKMKVLQIGKYYYPYKGGFESSLYTLVNELKDKLQLQILVSNTKCKTVIQRDGDLTIIRLANFGKIFSQPITPTFLFWIKRLKADIIHLHLPNPLAMISYLIASPSAKLIISYHNDIIRPRIGMILLRPLLIKILHKAEAIVVTSQNLINNSSVLKKFCAKCHIIPHGIDIDKFMPTEQVLKQAEKIRNQSQKPIVLFVGRLVYYKGLKFLIRAMKDIDAKLIIIGNGPLRFRLKILAKLIKVSDKILWLDNISDEQLPAYYYACDVFVLSSCANSESFGLVILEAHVCGKPVVSTNLPTGITFANLHQKTGIVVPPRDSQRLAYAINRLLESPVLCKTYGQNGKERVEKEFTKERMAEEVLRVYSNLG